MPESNFPNTTTSPRLTTLFGWTGNLADDPIAGQVRMYYDYGTNQVKAVDPNGNTVKFDPAGGGGGGSVQTVTVTLSAAQIKNWSGSSYPIIPAPGSARLNQLIAITYQYKFGTRAYRGGISNFAMTPQYHLDPSGFGEVADSPVGNMFTATANAVFMCTAETTPRDGDVGLGTILQSGAENLSIDLFGSGPNLVDGAIATNHLSNAGSGYAPGDTGTISSGNSDATYEVDTVDGGGAVLTYHLTDNGTGYAAPSFSLNTTASGGGNGFSLIVDTITPAPNQGDGTFVTTAYYTVVTLS